MSDMPYVVALEFTVVQDLLNDGEEPRPYVLGWRGNDAPAFHGVSDSEVGFEWLLRACGAAGCGVALVMLPVVSRVLRVPTELAEAEVDLYLKSVVGDPRNDPLMQEAVLVHLLSRWRAPERWTAVVHRADDGSQHLCQPIRTDVSIQGNVMEHDFGQAIRDPGMPLATTVAFARASGCYVGLQE